MESTMAECLDWIPVERKPSRDDDGRWIVCRFPPQIAERDGRGNAVWKQTWFRCGRVILGDIGWFLEQDGSEDGSIPSHYAFLHAMGDPDVIFSE